MSTYGELMIAEIDEVLVALNQHLINGYNERDIKNLLSKVASSTELFLKRDVFPAKSNRENFYSFIEELKVHFISQSKVDFAHAIRLEYNTAKHDPNSVVSILQVKILLENLKLLVHDIISAAIGRVGSPVRETTTRVFWICAWDHYIHGETEVTIFLPSEYDGFLGANSIDHISIHALKWENFKADLPNFGTVCSYGGLIPEGQVQFWLSEGDCLSPFVFEGEYSSLIICLSKYLKDVDLIPGLAREDNPLHLLQTAIMAASDAYANNPHASKELQYQIALTLSNNQYAVLPKFNERINHYILKVIDVIDKAPPHVKSVLTGPVWITKEAYDSNESIWRDDTIRMIIDSKNRILLGGRNP
ncbi:hypothetical protein [Acinetobacter johnsonii]|uniref:hypothetical protein n=1 Tax=Acinetobacter johnsonii TaxID=40214 RepID=UPI001F3D6320|nr:hypothetical protein [Acinetobacter johnsonii]UJA02499.1 hypothetical protein GBN93_16945 [Acinetobacter johnsonii]